MAVDTVRAWKEPEYRKSLTPEELANLPPSPVGWLLTEEEFNKISAGSHYIPPTQWGPPLCRPTPECWTFFFPCTI